MGKKKIKPEQIKDTRFEVVVTGVNGLGKAVQLNVNGTRYWFNCPEGVQKYGSLKNVSKDIFFTSNHWSNTSGLIGMLLTIQEKIASETVTLNGPPGIDRGLQMLSHFTEGNPKQLSRIEWKGPPDTLSYTNEALTIDYIPFLPVSTNTNDEYNKLAIAYIIKFSKSLPKIDVDKLVSLGVKSGPWVGELVRGNTVTLSDGREVKPEDVMMVDESDDKPVLVLECPTVQYIDNLLAKPEFKEPKFQMIVHMSPLAVVEDHRFQQFIQSCNSCTHIMLNEKSGPQLFCMPSFFAFLHDINPHVFPLLQEHQHWKETRELVESMQTGERSMITGVQGLEYIIKPHKQQGLNWKGLNQCMSVEDWVKMERDKVKDDNNKHLSMCQYVDEEPRFTLQKLDNEMVKWKTQLAQIHTDCSNEYPEVVFLGTCSARSHNYRNVSCILLQLRKDEYMLLDTGEGSLHQLIQLYGLEKAEHIIANLKAVFVSHLHYDHHGGLYPVLLWRKKVLTNRGEKKPLILLHPLGLTKWFKLLSEHSENIMDDIESVALHNVFNKLVKDEEKDESLIALFKSLGFNQCQPVPVKHVANSYGIVLEHVDGWKLTYSGDAMPSYQLVNHGKNSDILIHEGTFGVEEEEFAKLKRHSTTQQAIEVGREMKAGQVILTHFSAKYVKCPDFRDFPDNVSFAFDFMQVRPSQLKYFHKMKPVLYKSFGSNIEAILEMTERRNKTMGIGDDNDDVDSERQRMNKQQYVNERMRDQQAWKSSKLFKSLKKTEQKCNLTNASACDTLDEGNKLEENMQTDNEPAQCQDQYIDTDQTACEVTDNKLEEN